jgi:hypothetical protein
LSCWRCIIMFMDKAEEEAKKAANKVKGNVREMKAVD